MNESRMSLLMVDYSKTALFQLHSAQKHMDKAMSRTRVGENDLIMHGTTQSPSSSGEYPVDHETSETWAPNL